MISQPLTLSALAAFGIGMFAVSAVRRRGRGLDFFLVATRSVGVWLGGMSVASTWIWAPALFIAAQKAYQQGLPGLMWFTVPNVGCLILFGLLAPRIRDRFPRGYTLPQYVAERFDAPTHLVYLFTFFSLQICSLAVQLIAGAALLNAMSGLSFGLGVVVLAAIFTTYSLVDGLRASIRTDLFQMVIILGGMAVLIPMAVSAGGGMAAVQAGLAGAGGRFGSLFDAHVAYTFGITVTIGLMSGPMGDQQHWQRAFAFQPGKVTRGYLLGAAVFATVPLTMGLLGFLAVGNPDAAPVVVAGALPAQQVGAEVIRTLLPEWALILFCVMILSGLASTGDSALCAGGSLAAVDLYRRYLRPDATEGDQLRASRISVLAVALLAVGISLIPGITILRLFLFYGTLRSATLMPTILMMFRTDLAARGMFLGVCGAILFGMPLYLTGELTGNVDLKVAANVGILLISCVVPLLVRRGPHHRRP